MGRMSIRVCMPGRCFSAFQISSSRSSRPTACAAFRRVFKVTASYSGSSRRSSAADAHQPRHLCFGKIVRFHCGLDLLGENTFDGDCGDFFANALYGEPAIEGRSNVFLFHAQAPSPSGEKIKEITRLVRLIIEMPKPRAPSQAPPNPKSSFLSVSVAELEIWPLSSSPPSLPSPESLSPIS